MIFTHSNRITAKFVSLLAVTSMILSAFPASFFIAEAASTLFSEDFESNDFSLWDGSGSKWSLVDNVSGAHSGNIRATGKGNTAGSVLVKYFGAGSYENLDYSFWYQLDGNGFEVEDSLTFDYTVDGSTWIALETFTDGDETTDWTEVTGTISDITNATNFGIRFNVIADTGSDIFELEDILIEGDMISSVPDCDATDTVADTTFDTFDLGSVNAQNDWSATGASYDQEVVENTYGYDSFGCQSLRISNAVTSGSFGDWVFSAPTASEAGESTVASERRFEAVFDIASAVPDAEQTDLQIAVSPDDGNGARISYLRFNDESDGIHVYFNDYFDGAFRETDIDTLDRTEPHTIKFVVDFNDGPTNDIVEIHIDGVLAHTGTTWEDYFRDYQPSVSPVAIDSLIIQARDSQGTAPGTDGEGFLFDNMSLTVSTPAEGPKTSETIVVMEDTAAGENQEGWLFNRDPGNATPIQFNTDEASIGSGALYVEPLSSEPARKFIGEYFLLDEIANIDEISYDFLIGSGGVDTDENEFYMNVYANYGESADDKYYDCKYDVVPTVGSTAGFTTITFDPTQSYPVTTLTGKTWAPDSPYTCPSVPAAMNFQSPDSTIRMFALNMGDTGETFSGSGIGQDEGLDGYFDNVIVETKTKVTTFDFDPDTAKPDVNIDSPAHGEIVGTDVDVVGTASDADSGIEKVLYTVTQVTGIGCTTCYVSTVDSGTATGTESWNFSVSGLTTGFYRLKVQAFDNAGNWKYDTHDVEVDAEKPNVTIETPDHGEVFGPGTVHATGTATDGQTSIVEVKYTVTEIDAIGGTYVANVASGVATGTAEWDFMVELLDPGFYRLKVQAFDEDGNWRYKYHDIQVVEAPASLEITNPAADGETLEGEHTFEAEYTDDDDTIDTINWAIKTGGTCESNNTSVNIAGYGTDNNPTLTYNPVTGEIEVTVDMSTWDDGEYCFVVNPQETGGETDTERETRTFFLDNPEPIACVPGVNLLANASFEEPIADENSHKSGGFWELFESIPGWDSTADFELWNNMFGGASDGDQNAELATTEATKISQTIETIPGKEYTLSWDYSARPNTEVDENVMIVRVNDAEVQSNSLTGQASTDWKPKDYTFIADSTETTVSFEDEGNGVAGQGPLLDNTSLTCNEPTEPTPEYGPYCGDGYVNQEWEQCELGDEGCTNYCTLANQCSALQLVKIDLDETKSKSFDGTIRLGAALNLIPNDTWFLFDEDGDDSYVTIANEAGDEGGLAVERDTDTDKLFLAFRGGNNSTMLDIVSGTIETKGITFGDVDKMPNPTYKLETSAPAFEDVFDVDGTDTMVTFDLRADTGHDGVSVEIGEAGEYDCPLLDVIDGYKWNDEDGNGYWDEDEDPIEGWTIYIESDEYGLRSTTTDEYGYYYFEVEPEFWEVSENMVEGWQQTGLVNYMYPVFDTLITEDVEEESETTCEFLIGSDFVFKSEYEYGYRCDFGNQEIPEEELPVCNLSASDAKVEKGDNVTLSWSVGNAISVFIDNGIGSVATSGSEVVQIDNDTTFTMTITDEEEEESSCSVTVEGVPGGSSSLSSNNNGGGDAESGTPSVLGASTSAPQCGMYLYDYMKKGESNAIFEVQKLQLFLLSKKFYSVGLSGIFDDATEAAVKSFQSTYSDDVLMPWVNAGFMDAPTPTGYVYKTTRWKINDLVCPGSEAVPDVTNG